MKRLLFYIGLLISTTLIGQNKPLKDLSGRIEDSKVYLSWKPDTILPDLSVVLERETPYQKFTEIARIKLSENGQQEHYVSVDENPPNGPLKYRFRLISGNNEMISDTVGILNQKEEAKNSISFVGKKINIFIEGIDENQVEIRIRNIIGNEVYRKTIYKEPSESMVYTIDEEFPPGLYFLMVISSNKIYLQQKFSVD